MTQPERVHQADGLVADEGGAAAIEFGILALPFFLLIFAIIEVGFVFAGELTMDNAVDRIGRELRTGQIQISQPTREEFAELVCDRVSFLLDCDGLEIDLAAYEDFSAVAPGTHGRYELGDGGKVVTLTVAYDWPLFTNVLRADGSGSEPMTHRITGIAAFQTEAF